MRLLQKEASKDDPDPKALSCYGLYVPELGGSTWLRFVDGRPVSAITTQFLSWSCQKLEELGKSSLVNKERGDGPESAALDGCILTA